MAKFKIGSINYTKLKEAAEKRHSAFSRDKNGNVWINIIEWENETPDKYGNTASIQLNGVKEKREEEGKIYIANLKPSEKKTEEQQPAKVEGDSDLPF